jgi:iron complex transport system substrate-binding protein
VTLAVAVLFIVATAGLVRSQAAAPRRIVSLVPAVTEMLFAMGAGSSVVGVSNYDAFPPEVASLPKVGALVDPDFERILALRPDLVVAYGSQDELIARLGRARIAAFRYRHAGLPDITAMIRELGAEVGRVEDAARLARRIEAEIESVRQAVASERRPATMLIFEREAGSLRGIFASAGVGFLHDMLIAAGGRDVFEDVPRESLQVSTEVLLARAPEVIVELQWAGAWTAERVARERAAWAALPAIPAVRTGRIHFLTEPWLSVPGPRVAAAVCLLAETLHPRAIAALPRGDDGLPVVLARIPAIAPGIRSGAAGLGPLPAGAPMPE